MVARLERGLGWGSRFTISEPTGHCTPMVRSLHCLRKEKWCKWKIITIKCGIMDPPGNLGKPLHENRNRHFVFSMWTNILILVFLAPPGIITHLKHIPNMCSLFCIDDVEIISSIIKYM